jgi:hypothetical protein
VKIEFGDASVITHRDVTSYKPDLEIQRAMFLAELNKQRKARAGNDGPIDPPPVKEIVLKVGQSLKVMEVGADFIKLKL